MAQVSLSQLNPIFRQNSSLKIHSVIKGYRPCNNNHFHSHSRKQNQEVSTAPISIFATLHRLFTLQTRQRRSLQPPHSRHWLRYAPPTRPAQPRMARLRASTLLEAQRTSAATPVASCTHTTTTLELHFAKRNQEHCNVAMIVQLLLSWKKNLIIHKQVLFTR